MAKSKKQQEFERNEELRDMKKVLSTVEGRRVLWRFLVQCRTFSSIMTGNSMTYYNSGQQDLGHYLMAEIGESDEDALFLMMKEIKLMMM